MRLSFAFAMPECQQVSSLSAVPPWLLSVAHLVATLRTMIVLLAVTGNARSWNHCNGGKGTSLGACTSTHGYRCGFRLRIGVAMLVLQGISFLLFLLSTVLLLNETVTSLPWWRKWRPSPSDKFAAAAHKIMMRVCVLFCFHS